MQRRAFNAVHVMLLMRFETNSISFYTTTDSTEKQLQKHLGSLRLFGMFNLFRDMD